MIPLLKFIAKGDKPSSGHPVKARFSAWWNGYALDAIPAAGPASKADGGDAQSRTSAFREEALLAQAQARATPDTPWSEERRKLVQLIWGEGFIGPGGESITTELSQPMCLDSSASMIEIGAGMGGGTRSIAASAGTYVTGWDLDRELAEEAVVQAGVYSLEKKAAVHHLNPDEYTFKPNFYNGALIRESLYRIEEKEEFVKSIIESVKPESQVVIWDFFFEDSAAGPALEEWTLSEHAPVYPWSVDAARQCLVDNGVDIRVTTDETDRYSMMALDAWKKFQKAILEDPLGEDLAIPLVREVELWSRRTAALESGELRVYRISGVKRQPKD